MLACLLVVLACLAVPELAHHAGLLPVPTGLSPNEQWQVAVTLGLLSVACAYVGVLAQQTVAALRLLDLRERRLVLLVLVAGAAVRLLMDTRLTMIFSAYRLTEDIAQFSHVNRYGATTAVLYRLAFSLLPTHHETLVTVNRVAGSLTVPVVAALVARLHPPRHTVLGATALLALLPVLARNDASESNLTPILLWMSGGLLLLDHGLTSQRRLPLVGALAWLGLAATGRPETVVMAPLAAAALVLARHGWARGRVLLALGAPVMAAVSLPHVWHVTAALGQQVGPDRGGQRWQDLLPELASRLLPHHIGLSPEAFPLPLAALALLSLRHPQGRRVRAASLALTLPWVALLLVDLPRTSLPRLEAGIAMVTCVCAAWGIALEVQAAQRRRSLKPARPTPPLSQSAAEPWLIGVSAWLVVALSAIPSSSLLLRRTNEDEAEAVLQRILPLLPERGACLVAIGFDDPPTGDKVHRSLPSYLLRPPYRQVALMGISRWQAEQPVCPGGTFLLLEHRCYARYHTKPGVAPLLEVCRAVRARATALEEWTVPNHGNNEYGYYPEVAEFRVGLSRLDAAPAASGTHR